MSSPKHPLRVVLLIVGGIVGLVILAVILLIAFFPEARVRALVLEQTSNYLTQPVKIGKIGIALWPDIGLEVEGVSIDNAPEFGPEPLFSLERLVVAVNVSELVFDNTVHVTKLTIEKPRIALKIDEAGRSTLDDLIVPAAADSAPEPEPIAAPEAETPTDEAPPMPMGFLMDRMLLVGANVSYVDEKAGTALAIESIDQEVSLEIDPTMTVIEAVGKLDVTDLAATSEGMSVGPLSISVRHDLLADLDADSTRFEIGVTVASIPITLAGRVLNMSTKPDVVLDVGTGAIDVQNLLSQLPLPEDDPMSKLSATGSFTLAAHVETTVDPDVAKPPLDLDGRLKLDDITIRHPDFAKAVDHLGGEVTFDERAIVVRNVSVRAGRTSVDINAELRGWQGDRPMLRSADVNASVDLDEVAEIAPMPDSTAVGGKIDIALHASGPVSDPMAMNAGGRITLRDVRAESPALPLPISKISGSVEVTKRRIVVPDIGVWMGRSEIHLERTAVTNYLSLVADDDKGGKPSVTVTVRAPLIDLDEMLPATEEEEVPEDTTSIPDDTAIVPASPLPDIDLTANLQIDRLLFRKVEISRIGTRATVRAQRASVNGQAYMYTGRTSFDGWLDVADTKDVRYAFNWDVRNIEANDFLTVLTSFKDRFYGTTTSTGRLTGHGETYGELRQNISGDIDFRAGNGFLKNWPAVKSSSGKIASGIDRVRSGWGPRVVSTMGIDQDTVRYGSMNGDIKLRDGKALLENIGTTANGQEWRTNGWVSLMDGSMDVKSELTFSEPVTMQVAEGAATAVSTITAVSASDLAGALEPPNRLRVTIPIRGTTSSPDVGMPDLLAPFTTVARNLAEQRAREAAGNAARRAVEEGKKRLRGLLGR